MDPNKAQILAVVRVLKAKFTNLTAEEVITLAMDIIEALRAQAD